MHWNMAGRRSCPTGKRAAGTTTAFFPDRNEKISSPRPSDVNDDQHITVTLLLRLLLLLLLLVLLSGVLRSLSRGRSTALPPRRVRETEKTTTTKRCFGTRANRTLEAARRRPSPRRRRRPHARAQWSSRSCAFPTVAAAAALRAMGSLRRQQTPLHVAP